MIMYFKRCTCKSGCEFGMIERSPALPVVSA